MRELRPDVVVVGGGPAGLTAARCLATAGAGHVVVVERESEAGGIPRHSDHTGYGLRDLRRVMTGPAYARRIVADARAAGAEIITEAMVTGWAGERALRVTSPRGLLRVEARAVVLATGARERPRAARLVAGDRPAGVYTTGALQSAVHLHHAAVGTSAVIVGSELVSWSAVLTLREAGCRTALMTTEHDRPEAYAAFTLPGRALMRVPVVTRSRVTRIIGRERVRAVEVEDLATGARREVACDTVVFTGDWIPDHELARAAGLVIDPASLGPVVDTALRTSAPGVFAAGNLCHPVDTADVAALDGAAVAGPVLAWLRGGSAVVGDGVRLGVEAPLRWVSPGILRPGDPGPPRDRLIAWADEYRARPRVSVRQGGREVAARTLPWPMSPGRAFRIPSSLLDSVDRAGDDVTIAVR